MSEDHQTCSEQTKVAGDHPASAALWVEALTSTTYACAKALRVAVPALWSNGTPEGWDVFLPHAFQEPSAAQPRDAGEPSAGQEGDWGSPQSVTAMRSTTGCGGMAMHTPVECPAVGTASGQPVLAQPEASAAQEHSREGLGGALHGE